MGRRAPAAATRVRGARDRHGGRVLRHDAAEALDAGDRAAHVPAQLLAQRRRPLRRGAVRVQAAAHRRGDGVDREPRRRRGAHACRGRAAPRRPSAPVPLGRPHRGRASRAGRRVPPPGRPAPPGPHGHLRPQAVPGHGPAPAGREIRVAGLDLARRGGRRQQRDAAVRRARRGARGCSSTGPIVRRPRLVATRAIPRDESTAALERPRDAAGVPRRRGRTCWSCERRMRPGTSGRRGSRRAAPRCAAIPAWRSGTSMPMRPRRSSSRDAGPRSRSATDGRRYRWSVRRLGSARVLDRGTSGSPTLAVAVRLRSLGGRDADPAGGARIVTRRRSPCRAGGTRGCWSCCRTPPGRHATGSEANGDGYPDLLPEDPRVSLLRPYAGSGLPPGFAGDQSAVLLFLDRERLRYDITTDVALATSGGRAGALLGDPLRGRAAVLPAPHAAAAARVRERRAAASPGSAGAGSTGASRSPAGTSCAGGARRVRALFGERLRYERRGRSRRGA